MNVFEALQMYRDGTMKNYTEIARVGFTNDDYEIYVNTDDSGKIPHFHYHKKNNWDEFHTCIRIDTAEYFKHGNKNDTLNNKQKKELILFLNGKYNKYQTNWEALVELWNKNNSDIIIEEDIKMPDYKLL